VVGLRGVGRRWLASVLTAGRCRRERRLPARPWLLADPGFRRLAAGVSRMSRELRRCVYDADRRRPGVECRIVGVMACEIDERG